MSNVGRRFLFVLGVLVGLATLVLALIVLGRWLVPSFLGPLPPWLPEDHLSGMGFLLVADLLLWLPALIFSSLVLTFSYWLKPEELPKGRTQALIRFSLLAIVSTAVFAFLTLLGQPWVDSRLDNLLYR